VVQVPQPSPSVEQWKKPAFIFFLLAWTLNEAQLLLGIAGPENQWPEILLLVSATLTSLVALARRLPLQNVVMTAVLIGSISSIIMTVAILSGIPFGPYTYSDLAGDKIFGVLPWSIPLVWIVVIVNARGLARLVMRPWRKTNYYGFWVIGLACLLVVLMDLSLEPFAVYVKDYWIWQAPKWVWSWYSAPWINFFGWFLTALAILTFSTPWLINKQPVKQSMDYQPLLCWLLLNSWLITGNALHQLWPAVAVGLAGNAVATVFTIRGARW